MEDQDRAARAKARVEELDCQIRELTAQYHEIERQINALRREKLALLPNLSLDDRIDHLCK